MVERPRADADHRSDQHQHDEVCAVAPADHRGGHERDSGYREAQTDDPEVRQVVLRLVDRRSQAVEPVEEPVAQAPQQVERIRRLRDDVKALGELQYREPVGALYS